MRDYLLKFQDIVINLIPYKLRNSRLIAYITTSVKPLQTSADSFKTDVEDIRTFVRYDTRKIYLEKRLNDIYDVSQRRIEVTKLSPNQTIVMRQISEEIATATLYQLSEGENTYVFQSSETLSAFNFTVDVPAGAGMPLSRIERTVEQYQQSGTLFKVQEV